MTLHAHRFGPPDGPPLLVVHGITNTGARYQRFAEDQLPGVRVIAPDLRGHGLSPWEPPWHVGSHVHDLLELMGAEGLGAVPVLGHSFGGLVAMALAAAAPGRVDRLALVDPAVALDPARVLRDAEEAERDPGWATPDDARAARYGLYPPGDARLHAMVDEDVARFLAQGDDGRWRFRFSRSAVAVARSEMARPVPSLDGWDGPVMLAVAARADYVQPALVAYLRAQAGGRLTEAVMDSGHMIAWERPAELGAMVREWLA